MTGFSFQYFCNCVAILHESFLGVCLVFFFKPVLSKQSEIARPDVSLCWGWLESQWQQERTEVRTKAHHQPPRPASASRCSREMRPVPTGRWLPFGVSWAPDAGEMLESLCKVVGKDRGCKLDWPQLLGVDSRPWGFGTWKKPPRSTVKAVHLHSCSVEVWACRRGNGLCESGAYWFF